MTAVTSTSPKRGLLPPAALLIILMMLSGQAIAFDSDSDTICDDDIDVTGVCTAGPAGGDNCPLIPNTDQRNTDGAGDGGDACDDDDDNDMICLIIAGRFPITARLTRTGTVVVISASLLAVARQVVLTGLVLATDQTETPVLGAVEP
jgi:hypothetical protein